ncbi:hypothetical protein STRDD10_00415 [Streptococcus sp. DD10]|uniref:hypothetical protein n=1 Tax=Streptococcus sp. DD10 TaxID=1777878 RepID=UPI00079A2CCB|nr:hypothetical protein [Streptococcus sp. DD10]KXT75179.1 hypothetical protein STRDD10_00415 [Streptococcus sp. DD10]
MYNQKLIKIVKWIGLGGLLLLTFAAGYSLSNVQHQVASQRAKQGLKAPQTTLQTQDKPLTDSAVKDFLVSYYTRKELEENRPRYKPFMTESMYTETVTEEDKPVNQTYKGYIVDQVFDQATIYIDEENKVALATVRYTSTKLEEKDNRDSAIGTETSNVTIRLAYVNQNGKLLVNKLEPFVLSEPGAGLTVAASVTSENKE